MKKRQEVREYSCGVILFNEKLEVLLLRHLAGHWAFSKGHIEPQDKTREETALRELQEETGLNAKILGDDTWVSRYYPNSGVLKEVTYYLGILDGGTDPEVQESEITAIEWLSYEDALERLSHKENQEILRSAWRAFLDIRIQDENFGPQNLLSNTYRPAPAYLPVEDVETPSFIVDTMLLEDNLRFLAHLRESLEVKILLAQKAYSTFKTYPLISNYLDGTTASGTYEAQLAYDEMGNREVHVFSPAFKDEDITLLLEIADHIVFNSFHQWVKFRDRIMEHNQSTAKAISCGLRINPDFSVTTHDIYNPAAPGSRLGITPEEFSKGVEEYGLEGIEGLHFHVLCEDNSDKLLGVWEVVVERFGPWLKQMQWINMGGGHHLTREDYDVSLLKEVIDDCHSRYDAQVYLEPGEAVVLNTGFFVSEVVDLIHNAMDLAVLDSSATCHMPDVLEVPYQPNVFVVKGDTGERLPLASLEASDSHPYHYRLGGTSCLAGDVVGDYYFTVPLARGDRLVFLDMALYTMVKTNTFNGTPLPSIYLLGEEGLECIRKFSYEDFKSRL